MYMAKINLTHFVPELKTGQKVSLAILNFRLKIENGTENVARHFEFSS